MNIRLIAVILSTIAFGAYADDMQNPEDIRIVVSHEPTVEEGVGDMSFPLTDDDKDGVYDANLVIERGSGDLSALIFVSDKENADVAWGLGDLRVPFLYGDVPYEVILIQGEKNKRPSSIFFENWEGGPLAVSLRWNNFVDGRHCPLLTFTAPGQPKYGCYPDKLYLVGNFNSFGLPDSSCNNGAIELSHCPGAKTLRFEGGMNFEAGDIDMLIYCPEMGKFTECFWGLPISFPITMYKSTLSDKGTFVESLQSVDPSISSFIPQDGHIQIKDWVGGEIKVFIDLEGDSYVSLSSTDALTLDLPDTLTSYMKIGDLIESESGNGSPYLPEITKCESWLSMSGNADQSADDVWGSPIDEVIDLSKRPVMPYHNWIVPIKKGGYPLKFTCGDVEYATLSVIYNLYNGYAKINSTFSPNSSVDALSEMSYSISGGIVRFESPTNISVYTVDGVCVAENYSDNFDISRLVPGIYIIRSYEKAIKILI